MANEQIKQLTTVTKQAQSLNLADKSPEKIKMLKGDAETKPERSDSNEKVDDSIKKPPKKHWWQFGKWFSGTEDLGFRKEQWVIL